MKKFFKYEARIALEVNGEVTPPSYVRLYSSEEITAEEYNNMVLSVFNEHRDEVLVFDNYELAQANLLKTHDVFGVDTRVCTVGENAFPAKYLLIDAKKLKMLVAKKYSDFSVTRNEEYITSENMIIVS